MADGGWRIDGGLMAVVGWLCGSLSGRGLHSLRLLLQPAAFAGYATCGSAAGGLQFVVSAPSARQVNVTVVALRLQVGVLGVS